MGNINIGWVFRVHFCEGSVRLVTMIDKKLILINSLLVTFVIWLLFNIHHLLEVFLGAILVSTCVDMLMRYVTNKMHEL